MSGDRCLPVMMLSEQLCVNSPTEAAVDAHAAGLMRELRLQDCSFATGQVSVCFPRLLGLIYALR